MAYFNPNYQDPWWGIQPPPQTPIQLQTQAQTQSMFIRVKSEAEAYNWPIAPGNSLVFKNETEPYLYVKTLGFSQLGTPTFEKYRLEREEPQTAQPKQGEAYALRSELAIVAAKINELEKLMKGDAENA